MVLLGAPVEASREDLGRMPVVGPDARRSARRAGGALGRARAPGE